MAGLISVAPYPWTAVTRRLVQRLASSGSSADGPTAKVRNRPPELNEHRAEQEAAREAREPRCDLMEALADRWRPHLALDRVAQ